MLRGLCLAVCMQPDTLRDLDQPEHARHRETVRAVTLARNGPTVLHQGSTPIPQNRNYTCKRNSVNYSSKVYFVSYSVLYYVFLYDTV